MNLQSKPTKGWTKPELKRIGRIADVAGAQNPVSQAGSSTSAVKS
ncbi:MAG: hypothetical protein AB7F98_09980 [Novosphingobium sp.]